MDEWDGRRCIRDRILTSSGVRYVIWMALDVHRTSTFPIRVTFNKLSLMSRKNVRKFDAV